MEMHLKCSFVSNEKENKLRNEVHELNVNHSVLNEYSELLHSETVKFASQSLLQILILHASFKNKYLIGSRIFLPKRKPEEEALGEGGVCHLSL